MSSIHATKVLGLTSGSSLDGVNASIIITDGIDVFERVKTFVLLKTTVAIALLEIVN